MNQSTATTTTPNTTKQSQFVLPSSYEGSVVDITSLDASSDSHSCYVDDHCNHKSNTIALCSDDNDYIHLQQQKQKQSNSINGSINTNIHSNNNNNTFHNNHVTNTTNKTISNVQSNTTSTTTNTNTNTNPNPNTTSTTITSNHNNNTNHNSNKNMILTVSLQRNIYMYIVSTTLAWIILLSHILPSIVLYTLSWIILSTIIMIYILYNHLYNYYYHLIVYGNGLGTILLPQSIYNMMIHTSIHELLIDEKFELEYRHLLLYFLPISSQQLHILLSRLAPNHQRRLLRHGEIGNIIFGQTIMKMLIGYQQYNNLIVLQQHNQHNHNQQQQQQSRQEVVVSTTTIQTPPQRRSTLLVGDDDDDDNESDLGLDISSDDLIDCNKDSTAMAERLGLLTVNTNTNINNKNNNNIMHNNTTLLPPNEVITTRTMAKTSSTNTITSSNSDYNEQEYQVLMDALWESFYNIIWNPINDYITITYTIPYMYKVRTISYYTGISLLSISFGNLFGLWDYSYTILYNTFSLYIPIQRMKLLISNNTSSNNNNHNHHNNVHTSSIRSMSTLNIYNTTTWSTALLGTASLGISYYSRQYIRNYNTTNNNMNNNLFKKDTTISTKLNHDKPIKSLYKKKRKGI